MKHKMRNFAQCPGCPKTTKRTQKHNKNLIKAIKTNLTMMKFSFILKCFFKIIGFVIDHLTKSSFICLRLEQILTLLSCFTKIFTLSSFEIQGLKRLPSSPLQSKTFSPSLLFSTGLYSSSEL